MLATDILQLLSAMDIEKALPYDNRIVTNAVRKMIGENYE